MTAFRSDDPATQQAISDVRSVLGPLTNSTRKVVLRGLLREAEEGDGTITVNIGPTPPDDRYSRGVDDGYAVGLRHGRQGR